MLSIFCVRLFFSTVSISVVFNALESVQGATSPKVTMKRKAAALRSRKAEARKVALAARAVVRKKKSKEVKRKDVTVRKADKAATAARLARKAARKAAAAQAVLDAEKASRAARAAKVARPFTVAQKAAVPRPIKSVASLVFARPIRKAPKAEHTVVATTVKVSDSLVVAATTKVKEVIASLTAVTRMGSSKRKAAYAARYAAKKGRSNKGVTKKQRPNYKQAPKPVVVDKRHVYDAEVKLGHLERVLNHVTQKAANILSMPVNNWFTRQGVVFGMRPDPDQWVETYTTASSPASSPAPAPVSKEETMDLTHEQLKEIQQYAAVTGSPTNTLVPYTNPLDGAALTKLWKTNEVIPNVGAGLTALYGPQVAAKLNFKRMMADESVGRKATLSAMYLGYVKLMQSQHKQTNNSVFNVPVKPNENIIIIGEEPGILPNISGLDLILHIANVQDIISHSHYNDAANKYVQFLGVEDIKSAIYQTTQNTEYTKAAVIIGYTTYYNALLLASEANVTFIVDSHVYSFIKETFGELPTNIRSIQSGWCDSLHFRINKNMTINFFESFIKTMGANKAGKALLTSSYVDGGKTYRLGFENLYFLDIKDDGVYEVDRCRQLYNAVIVNKQALAYTTGELKDTDVRYMTSFGVLIRFIVMNAGAFCAEPPYMAAFFRKRLSKELPFVALKDLGKQDGDRHGLTKFTAMPDYVSLENDHPFVWVPNGDHMLVKTRGYFTFKNQKFAGYRIDAAVFRMFNLVRNKDKFVDGRRVALQLKHIQPKYRIAVAKLICHRAYKLNGAALDAALIKDFKLEAANYSHKELWERISNELVVGLSSKLSKLVKRAVMYCAQIGDLFGSESRNLKQYGQTDMSENVLAMPSVIALCHNASPGMAEMVKGEVYLTVPHRITRVMNLTPVILTGQDAGKIVVNFDKLPEPTSVERVGVNLVHKFQPPINVEYNAPVCYIPYKSGRINEIDYVTINNTIPEGQLHEIHVRQVGFGLGKQLECDVYVTHTEGTIKARDIQKAMLTKVPANVLYNDLNQLHTANFNNLSVQTIWYRDTNKWQDVVSNLLPVIYLTAGKNAETWPEAAAEIARINTIVGRDNEWAPVLDLLGIYEPLRAMFESKFGKSLWLSHEELNMDRDESYISLQYRMYENAEGWMLWNDCPYAANLPEWVTGHRCYVQTDSLDKIDDKTNIIIFGRNDNGTSFYFTQRSYSYVGTKECPLYVPVKGEMSSVRTGIGVTKMMLGVARSISLQDKAFGNACVTENFAAYEKYAAFIAMIQDKNIVDSHGTLLRNVVMNRQDDETGLYYMTNECRELVRTDEIKKLLKATQRDGSFLRELARKFNDVVFTVKYNEKETAGERTLNIPKQFKLFLPAIVMQSAATDFRSSDDMSSNIRQLFTYLVNGGSWTTTDGYGEPTENTNITTLVMRIRGAMSGLINSKRLTKCAAFGVNGVTIKTVALSGIKINEIYIRKSNRFDSAYQTMRRTYNIGRTMGDTNGDLLSAAELHNFPVIMSRSPMTIATKLKIVVIDSFHPMAEYISEDVAAMNPITCYIHRGDNDGDQNAIFPGIINGIVCKLPYLTVSALIASIKSSTGTDHLVPGGSYYGDGLEIPTWKSVMKKRELKAANLALSSSNMDLLDPNALINKERPALTQLLAGSSRMMNEAVGMIHRVFLTLDIFTCAINELLDHTTVFNYNSSQPLQTNLIQILAEIYEVPLGGFDHWAYLVFYGHLFNSKQENTNNTSVDINAVGVVETGIDSLSFAMTQAGMNGSITYDPETGDKVQDIPQALIAAVNLVNSNDRLPKSKMIKMGLKTIIDNNPIEKAMNIFFGAVSAVSVLLSKGELNPFLKGKIDESAEVIDQYYEDDYDACYDDVVGYYGEPTTTPGSEHDMLLTFVIDGLKVLDISEEQIKGSVVLAAIWKYYHTVRAAMNEPTVVLDLNYFTVRGKAVELDDMDEDNNNDDGGSVKSSTSPKPPSDGSGLTGNTLLDAWVKPSAANSPVVETTVSTELTGNTLLDAWVKNSEVVTPTAPVESVTPVSLPSNNAFLNAFQKSTLVVTEVLNNNVEEEHVVEESAAVYGRKENVEMTPVKTPEITTHEVVNKIEVAATEVITPDKVTTTLEVSKVQSVSYTLSIFNEINDKYNQWWKSLPAGVKDLKKFPEWKLLSADQFVAIYEIVRGHYLRITLCGQGGSGKSFVIMFSKKLLEALNHDVLLTSSTGISAYLLGPEAGTIAATFSLGAHNDILPMGIADNIHHSVKPNRKPDFQGNVEPQKYGRKSVSQIAQKVRKNNKINSDNRCNPLVVFMEEVGMVSAENIQLAMEVLYEHLGWTKKDGKRKRKVRFVFLGDYRQLLAVPNKSTGTPWDTYTSLAFQPARFESMSYEVKDGQVVYYPLKHQRKSPIGLRTDENGKMVAAKDAIFLSLITNHRQAGAARDFVDDLNKLGAGEGSFNPNNMLKAIAARIYCQDGNEYYHWLDSKKKINTVLNTDVFEKATHVHYTNAEVSRKNNAGTRKAMDNLFQKHGATKVKQYYRDYLISITTKPGVSVSEIENKVITDIAPIGVTVLNTSDQDYMAAVNQYQHLPMLHSKDKKTTTFAFQRICVGMRWMCRMNLSESLKNGTTAVVTHVADDHFMVAIDNDLSNTHHRVEAQTELFVSRDGKDEPIAIVKGVPGHAAYAITFHKTQGMTVKNSKLVLHLDSVLIGLAKTQIMHGLFYVGCSRVQDPEQLIILYKSSRPIIDGLNSLCKADASVFDFIKFTEETMHQILNGTYVHLNRSDETIIDVEIVDVEITNALSENKAPALNPVVDSNNPLIQLGNMFNNQ